MYTAMNAFAQAAVTFTSQNIGARKYHNLDRVIRNCLLCAVVTGLVLAAAQRWRGTSCCASTPRTQRSLPPVPSGCA